MKSLLCDLGMFVEGSEGEGVYVRYWGNQRLRELSTYRGGVKDGFTVRTYGPANPPQFSHYRYDEPFGETLRYFSNGTEMEHVLLDGESKILFTDEDAGNFRGYLTTEAEEELFRKYAVYPNREVFM